MISKEKLAVLYPLNRNMITPWFIQYPNPNGGKPLKKYGKLNRLSNPEERLREAEAMIKSINQYLSSLIFPDDDIPKFLDDVVKARCIGKRKKTTYGYYSKLKMFVQWYRLYSDRRINEMTGNKFLAWVSKQPGINSNTTINGYRRHLKSFFEDLKGFGIVSINPFTYTRKLRETQTTNTWFRKEVQVLLKEMIMERDLQLWIVCQVQYYCFIRPGEEMRALKVCDILTDRKHWRFRVEGTDAKVGRFRFVPIPDELKLFLEPYISGFPPHYYLFGRGRMPSNLPLGANTLYNRHRAYLQALGLPEGYTLYSWKNTGAVMMYGAGIKLKYISLLMGHTNIETTDRYFKSLGIDDIMDEILHQYPIL
ncbi:MAG: tyrosine-type recombinase/integrase [Chitinophagaceae bacterium]|nr:tyrosine-type recombinase/integrase [Chitinophagaceae bacterium]MDP1763407.1 site-specific integrase [Sediminibacterium sp.]